MRAAFVVLLAVAAVLGAAETGGTAHAARRPRKPPRLTVMTQNLYLGMDLERVTDALASAEPAQVPGIVGEAFETVKQTDFAARADKLAEFVAAAKPDVIGLQEVVIWRTQETSDFITGTVVPNARKVEYDFLRILLRALRRHRQRYRVGNRTVGVDVEAPYLHDGNQVGDLRLTDQDVVLVRRGVRTSRKRSGNFAASASVPVFGGTPVTRSYVALDVRRRRARFHVVATHIEYLDADVRDAQAQELLAGPLESDLPTVVLGDFNTDAAQDVKDETYAILTSVLTETWPVLHPGEPGLTWGQTETLDNEESTVTQRLDMVFTKGDVTPISIDLVGEVPEDKVNGLWPSDHVGVIATYELQ